MLATKMSKIQISISILYKIVQYIPEVRDSTIEFSIQNAVKA